MVHNPDRIAVLEGLYTQVKHLRLRASKGASIEELASIEAKIGLANDLLEQLPMFIELPQNQAQAEEVEEPSEDNGVSFLTVFKKFINRNNQLDVCQNYH